MQIIKLVDFAFNFYIFMLFARIIMSWIPVPDNPTLRSVTGFIVDITEPYLGLFRRVLPTAKLGGAGIDFSPMLGFLVLYVIRDLVITILRQSLF